jgi:hypothetical protein
VPQKFRVSYLIEEMCSEASIQVPGTELLQPRMSLPSPSYYEYIEQPQDTARWEELDDLARIATFAHDWT